MAKEIPSVGDLRRKSEVTDDKIEGTTAAYLKDQAAEPFAFKSGHTIDVAAAVEAHLPAKVAVVDPDRSAKFKRNVIRTAILLAHPVKG